MPLVRSSAALGAHHAKACVVTCGPAMVALLATGHALVPMVVMSGALIAERIVGVDPRRRYVVAAVFAGVGLCWLLVASTTTGGVP